MVTFIFARHCLASGQERESSLTKEGERQAQVLSVFLEHYPLTINRIVSSPFLRAVKSIEPFALTKGMEVELDERIRERKLSDKPIEEWLEILERTFSDLELKVHNGESSNEAMERAGSLIEELKEDCGDDETVLIMSHGNIMTLMLKYFDDTFGYEDWKNLSNPDLYLVTYEHDRWNVKRIYNS